MYQEDTTCILLMQMYLVLIYLTIILMRKNSYKKCLVIIVLAHSMCQIYSNPHLLLKVCQIKLFKLLNVFLPKKKMSVAFLLYQIASYWNSILLFVNDLIFFRLFVDAGQKECLRGLECKHSLYSDVEQILRLNVDILRWLS